MQDASTTPPRLFPPSLASLVWPLAPTAFRSGYWQRRVLVSRGGRDRIASILGAGESLDLADLLEAAGGSINVWSRRADGRVDFGVAASSADALRAYSSNRTLYFHLEGTVPAAGEWLERIAGELGHDGDGRLSVFATKSGAGSPLHFDANDNFTIQLAGSKTWSVQPNTQIEAPTANWFASTPVCEDLLAIDPSPYPERTSPDAESVRLDPGDILYLPRGYWHATTEARDSLSLNLMLRPRPWIDQLLLALRRVLVGRREWRESAPFGAMAPAERLDARGRIAALLSRLPEELGRLVPEDFLSASRPCADIRDETRLVRRPATGWSMPLPPGEHAADAIVRIAPLADHPQILQVPGHQMGAFRWVAARNAPFTAREVAQRFEIPAPEVREMLAALVESGFLAPAADDAR